jgi:hypothetical protein
MTARILAIVALFAMFWVVPKYLLSPDTDSIAVHYNGSYPVPVELNFDSDCAMTMDDGTLKTKGDCDFNAASAMSKPTQCNVELAFLPIERQVTRLHARVVMLKGGKEIGRGSVSIDRLAYIADDNQWSRASFRSKCEADELRLTEATAIVDGTATDLIASGMVHGTGIIPWLPVGSAVIIGDGQG